MTKIKADEKSVENNDEVSTENVDENRDQQADDLAKELGNDDFEPAQELTKEQIEEMKQKAKEQIIEASKTIEGSRVLSAGLIVSIEKGLKFAGNKRFKIEDESKDEGIDKLAPMINKYAPDLVLLAGEWEHELKAGWWAACFIFGSVRQIKALNKEDALVLEDKETPETKKAAA